MKYARRFISVFAYRKLYDPEGAIKQLIENVLHDVPSADVIQIAAVDLFDSQDEEISGQAALFSEEDVRSSVREPVLPDEYNPATHSQRGG